MAKADSSMQMVIFTMVIGRMIRHMASEYTAILTEQDMKAIGKKTSSTERDLKHGQMVLAIKEIMSKERSMERANSHGQMAALIVVNFTRTTLRVKVSTIGPL
jgi:hypothetical protein